MATRTRLPESPLWCAALALALTVTLGGCDEDPGPDAQPKEDIKPLVPVDLPAVPDDLGKSEIPEKYADGSLTIDGILRNRRVYLDQDVLVKGIIVWIYECPYADEYKKRRRQPKKSEDEEENLCQRDHFYIADKARSDDRLLVVGLSPFLKEALEKDKIKIGEQHVFNGRFTEIADGFAAADEGLLQLGEVKGFEEPEEEQ